MRHIAVPITGDVVSQSNGAGAVDCSTLKGVHRISGSRFNLFRRYSA
jgi:hypothetical protein